MKTVLAVDNDSTFLEELELGLELYGYRVITESSPHEALRQARELKPDCILFDLRMPEKHGFQFSEELKSDSALRRIPAIAMTAYYNKDYDLMLSIFGIFKFLKKPFSPEDAVNMIKATTE